MGDRRPSQSQKSGLKRTDEEGQQKEPVPDLKKVPFEKIFYRQDFQQAALKRLVECSEGTKRKLPTDDKLLTNEDEHQLGDAMVDEMLRRYGEDDDDETDVNAKKSKKDDFDYEDWEEKLEAKSDFKKQVIPQYEVKERLFRNHCAKIEQLGEQDISNICADVMPELKKIKKGKVKSKRHDIFKVSGLCLKELRNLTITKPFNSRQENIVFGKISEMLTSGAGDQDIMDGKMMNYVCNVLIQEALIRIYAIANGISVELSEKELLFGAGYDGLLDDSIIRSLEDDDSGNK